MVPKTKCHYIWRKKGAQERSFSPPLHWCCVGITAVVLFAFPSCAPPHPTPVLFTPKRCLVPAASLLLLSKYQGSHLYVSICWQVKNRLLSKAGLSILRNKKICRKGQFCLQSEVTPYLFLSAHFGPSQHFRWRLLSVRAGLIPGAGWQAAASTECVCKEWVNGEGAGHAAGGTLPSRAINWAAASSPDHRQVVFIWLHIWRAEKGSEH